MRNGELEALEEDEELEEARVVVRRRDCRAPTRAGTLRMALLANILETLMTM